jgi:hypothetical protein
MANLEVAADVVPLDVRDQPVALRRACDDSHAAQALSLTGGAASIQGAS